MQYFRIIIQSEERGSKRRRTKGERRVGPFELHLSQQRPAQFKGIVETEKHTKMIDYRNKYHNIEQKGRKACGMREAKDESKCQGKTRFKAPFTTK